VNEYSALAIVQAVNTTKREIALACRKVRRTEKQSMTTLLDISFAEGIEVLSTR